MAKSINDGLNLNRVALQESFGITSILIKIESCLYAHIAIQ